MPIKLSSAAALGLCLSALLPALAHADFDSAYKAYREQNYDSAFKQFSQLSALGDNRAKSFEAMMTLRGQGTAMDIKAGAQLARECAQGGEPTCYAMYAQLNLPGQGLPVDLPEARIWTRRALAGGDLRAGMILWQAYGLDPANEFVVDGKVDPKKYRQLAQRTAAQRSDQVEATDALASSAALGYEPARLALATSLMEQSGAGTAYKISQLLGNLSDLPGDVPKYLRLAQQVDALGPTRASPKLVADLIPAVRAAAAQAATRAGSANASQCKDFQLAKIEDVSPITNAAWLPATQPLVSETYVLSGTWQEQWQIYLCGATRNVRLRFEADGMGGAAYRILP